MAERWIDELRQDGQEEEGDFGIEQIGHGALSERRRPSVAAAWLRTERSWLAQHLPTEPNQVDSASHLDNKERLWHGRQEGGEAKGGSCDVNQCRTGDPRTDPN